MHSFSKSKEVHLINILNFILQSSCLLFINLFTLLPYSLNLPLPYLFPAQATDHQDPNSDNGYLNLQEPRILEQPPQVVSPYV